MGISSLTLEIEMAKGILTERGLRPWEVDMKDSPLDGYATLSVVCTEGFDVCNFLNAVCCKEIYAEYEFVRWHTELYQFHGSLIQERKIQNALSAETEDIEILKVSKSSQSDVYHSLSKLRCPIHMKSIEILSDYRREWLLLCTDEVLMERNFQTSLDELSGVINPVEIIERLLKDQILLIGRLYQDVDTHFCFQLFGIEEVLHNLLDEVKSFDCIYLSDRKEVSMLLRS